MSKCELPNSVSIGSKLDQENQENGPNVARGATFSDVDRGWAFVVLLSSSVCMFVGATLSYGTGVVHVALLEKFKKDAAFTSLIGSIFFSLLSLMGKQTFIDELCPILLMLGYRKDYRFALAVIPTFNQFLIMHFKCLFVENKLFLIFFSNLYFEHNL